MEVAQQYSAIPARAVPAEVVHLQEADAIGEDLEILCQIALVLDVVNETEVELCAGGDAFDLTRVRGGADPTDGVFKFDLADVGVQFHRGKPLTGRLRHADVGKLQTRAQTSRTALRRRTEKSLDHRAVLIDLVQKVFVRREAACKECADLPLERTAGDDGPLRHRIAQERAVHCTDGRKVGGRTDVHPSFEAQDRPNVKFSLQCPLSCILLLHHHSPSFSP